MLELVSPAAWSTQFGLPEILMMKELNQQEGTTFVFSTHDAAVMKLATRVVRVLDGRVVDNQVQAAEPPSPPAPPPTTASPASAPTIATAP